MSQLLPIVLYDEPSRHANLLPLSYTRPLSEFRVGIVTIREKWERMLPGSYSWLTPDYLRSKFPCRLKAGQEGLFVASNVLPDAPLVAAVASLAYGERLEKDGEMLAYRGTDVTAEPERRVEYAGEVRAVRYVFDIFLLNGRAICDDFRALTAGRDSVPMPETNTFIGKHLMDDGVPSLFIEEGARVEGAFLNVTDGPIYIGRDAQVMEGSMLRGPLAVCTKAKVNMGAKMYGSTTLGPYCKVGGEVNNLVMQGYSNKAHDGFLGNAVIGEWCNIGAGTNASNLKNDYSKIRIWNYPGHTFMRTDLQFCGLIMGDHSKVGVNCMLNTATVLGVGVNLHGSGFPRPFVPSFSEGSAAAGFTDVPLSKFYAIAERAMKRRGIELTDGDREIFEKVREVAAQFK